MWKSNDLWVKNTYRSEKEIRIQQQTKHLNIVMIFLSQPENLNLAFYNPNGNNILMTNIQQCKQQPHQLRLHKWKLETIIVKMRLKLNKSWYINEASRMYYVNNNFEYCSYRKTFMHILYSRKSQLYTCFHFIVKYMYKLHILH